MRTLIARTAALTLLSSGAFALSALAPANAYDPDASCGSPAPGVTTHEDNGAPVPTDVTVPGSVVVGQGRTIDLTSAISDPDGDTVSVVGIQNPKNGYVCQQGNEVFYVAFKAGTETLRYGVTDGAQYRTANLTITTRDLVVKAPQVLTKAKLVKGKITKRATVRLNNADTEAPVTVLVEKESKNSYGESQYELGASTHRDFSTSYRSLVVAIFPGTEEDDEDFGTGEPAAVWRIDTVTGSVSRIKDGDFRRAGARSHR